MRAANIPCWIETQRKMKWRSAMRIASHPEERWTKKDDINQLIPQARGNGGNKRKRLQGQRYLDQSGKRPKASHDSQYSTDDNSHNPQH